ncbi:hypothetical protein SMSP2_01513 [Limihaloglobus sulfuriphilus]|uniref:LamG-like jellyroll fold domain-containing protein n=1 Tax=Limihaloglobus sulfuriphilus TaxID=1851148 RepID=A0A1Q2MF24_9BACT|nr:LamG-like jellyroll fold domain-containing protein [Limihaloglobus sulfuriphilus]AQQ71148.1 hypothetical protein SMSP2_01513 [Limihaloglobus sulfuriphilus]
MSFKVRVCAFFVFIVLTFCGSVFAAYADIVASDEPVVWLRFDEYIYSDGRPAEDAAENIGSATYQGDAMPAAAGIDVKSCWFNGHTAGIDLGSELGPLLDGSEAITFEAWIKNSYLSSSESGRQVFITMIDDDIAGLGVEIGAYNDSSGYLRVGARSNINDQYANVVTAFTSVNQWTHLACVADFAADNMKIYYNGVLKKNSIVNFSSDSYTYGGSSQNGQIGRTPDMEKFYRGFIDEAAVYNKALSENEIVEHYTSGSPSEPADLWVSQVNDEGTAEGPYLASPSVYKFSSGVIVASHDYWGPNNPFSSGSVIKISYDNGKTWWHRGQVTGVKGGSLFEHNGALYHLGASGGIANITIAKSTNYGATWTTPTNSTSGLLFEAEEIGTTGYSSYATTVLFANGRVYRVFEPRVSYLPFGACFWAVIISADLDDDLLDASSWTMTNSLQMDPSWPDPAWNCKSPGWTEGNAVQGPDGQIYAVMRFHSDPAVNKAAVLTLSEDNTTLSFDPQTGFIDFPGGRNKFHIHRDSETGVYLSLVNNNTDPSRPAQRNTLSLIASDDVYNWRHVRTIIQDNSPMSWYESMLNVGFQYVVWDFDGDDMIFVSRTAYDGAANYHDSNKITFHRIENYMDFVAACGNWGYSQMDLNMDCVVDLMDFSLFFSDWMGCTRPYYEGCVEGNF